MVNEVYEFQYDFRDSSRPFASDPAGRIDGGAAVDGDGAPLAIDAPSLVIEAPLPGPASFAHQPHDGMNLREVMARDLRRALATASQDILDVGRLARQPLHLGAQRAENGDREIGKL